MDSSIPEGQRRACKRLIKRILADSNVSISVFYGGGWAVKNSRNMKAILDGLGNTGIDDIHVWDYGYRVGWFSLVWFNEEDGSTLISEHLDNEYCDAIFNKHQEFYNAT